jgi:transmembrane sensor
MNKLIKFPDTRRVTEEACQWLVRIEDGLSPEQEREVNEWLQSDSRHPEALVQLAELWDEFDCLSDLAEIFPLNQYRAQHRTMWNMKTAVVATSLIVIAGMSIFFAVQRPDGIQEPAGVSVALPGMPESGSARSEGRTIDGSDISERSYETAVGEQLSARLPDGSVITMNTDTSLEVEYTQVERRVVMQRGEASFDVDKDSLRPFRVLTGSRIVQAVGTIFNIEMNSDRRLEVTVSEGSVVVSPIATASVTDDTPRNRDNVDAEAPDLRVNAGELATINGVDERVRTVDLSEIQEQLAWQQGMLIYRGTSLEDVLADVSRYTTLKLTIADESIRNKRVGGFFRAGDIDALLVALRESFDIEPRRVGDEILLTASQ